MKRRLLFVDDELNLLMGLKRSLRSMNDEWDMEFAEGGEAALNLLDKPFDVVVSDLRMPGISGLELLNTVQERYPQTIRVLLSGQADGQSILESVSRAHQYLSKPIDTQKLKSLLAQTIALGDYLDNESLKSFISGIDSIPSLPALYSEIMDALRESDPSPVRIGGIISRDLGMTAKILQVANSVFYAMQAEVTDPEQAVMVLGLDTIRSLVISLSVFSSLVPGFYTKSAADSLWQHSNIIAAICRTIANAEGVGSTAFGGYISAGLLHDIGKLIIASSQPETARRVAEIAKEEAKQQWQVELELMGCTHAEVGAYLLGIWGLPFPIVEAVAWHHRPSQCLSNDMSPLAAVHVANVLRSQAAPHSHLCCGLLDTAFLARIGRLHRLEAWSKACAEILQKPIGHS
jgi:Predicted signal transduction protein